MDLGRRLKEARERAGLSQEALARQADVSTVAVSQIEQGRTKEPHYLTLYRLSKVLGVSPHWLYTGERAEEPALAGKAEAPQAGPSRDEQIIEGMISPWVAWLERDSEALDQLVVTAYVHKKLSRDRRNVVAALDEVGDALEALGIDWGDRSNRAMRRAHDALLWAFGEWHGLSIEASAAYLDSRARVEEERHIPRIFKAVA
jgi:transcriptional regulator with XRE-family HTH domain